jgi:hypothetical protein
VKSGRAIRVALLLAFVLAAGIVAEHHTAFIPLRFAIQRDPALMPSTKLAPAREVYRGLPLVSLYVSQHDLYDQNAGILANKLQHGDEWERPGTVSFFESGQLEFSAGVGVRVHGGGTRKTLPEPAFRLFFRRKYGSQSIPAGVVFEAPHDHPVNRLILHNDIRVDPLDRLRWHFANPLAYDIARAIGGITPATKPARMLLNGEFLGVYVLTEHFHERHFFTTHFGHPVRLNGAEMDALWEQVRGLEPPRAAAVARLVDLPNMTRWFISVLVCATTDPYQGPAQFRDPTREEAQWFFVNWDMDWSFRDWRQETFQALTERIGERRRGRRRSEPRAYLFTRLLAEDPDYRNLFKRMWVDAMNYRVTPAFLRQRIEYYRAIALQYGVPDLEYHRRIEEFFEHRPARIRQLAEQWLNTPPSVKCRLTGSGRVMLDGHVVEPPFEGYYFPGMQLTLDVPEPERGRFSHWQIGGRRMAAPSTSVEMNQDLEIAPVWRSEGQGSITSNPSRSALPRTGCSGHSRAAIRAMTIARAEAGCPTTLRE